MNKYCKRCGELLTGRRTSWCSMRCSRLGLKAIWRKKNKEKVNKYNREYKLKNKWGKKHEFISDEYLCFFCRDNKELQLHHLDYEKAIGVYLCRDCHFKLHQILKLSNLYYEKRKKRRQPTRINKP